MAAPCLHHPSCTLLSPPPPEGESTPSPTRPEISLTVLLPQSGAPHWVTPLAFRGVTGLCHHTVSQACLLFSFSL